MSDSLVPAARYRPAQLPGERQILIASSLQILPGILADFMSQGKQSIYPPEVIRTPGTSVAQAAGFMARSEAYRLQQAALYYVAPDMTALAMSAGRDLPDYPFSPDDLPSPYGFCVFDGPYPEVYDEPWTRFVEEPTEVPAHLTAISWGPITDPGSEDCPPRPGVWFTYYSDRDASDAVAIERGIITRENTLESLRAGYGRSHFVYDNESLIFGEASWRDIADEWQRHEDPTQDPRAEVGSEHKPRVGPQIMRTLLAASLLMREPLARITSEPEEVYSRPERRRLHREGLADRVHVVHLRQTERAPSTGDGESHGRDYTCRWPVVGHWRRQWYPSEQRHRPRYIPPYIKGPADKPFRTRETVRAWDR